MSLFDIYDSLQFIVCINLRKKCCSSGYIIGCSYHWNRSMKIASKWPIIAGIANGKCSLKKNCSETLEKVMKGSLNE